MSTINESIEQLTASLQELTAKTYCHDGEHLSAQVDVNRLRVSDEVEKFVTEARAYADKTRNVSVGTY